MSDRKYVVFKLSDWLDQRQVINDVSNGAIPHGYAKKLDDALSALDKARLDDAVVIRRQDVFAPPALDAYANLITAAISIAQDAGGHIPGVDEEPESVAKLREIADYFHTQAEEAYANSQRKIPD